MNEEPKCVHTYVEDGITPEIAKLMEKQGVEPINEGLTPRIVPLPPEKSVQQPVEKSSIPGLGKTGW